MKLHWSIYLLVPKSYGEFHKRNESLTDELRDLMEGYDPHGLRMLSIGWGDEEEYDEKIAIEYIEYTKKNFLDWVEELKKETDYDTQVGMARNLDLDNFQNNWLIGFKMGNIMDESEFVPIWNKRELARYLSDVNEQVYMVSLAVHL